jgi:hypothetical protein
MEFLQGILNIKKTQEVICLILTNFTFDNAQVSQYLYPAMCELEIMCSTDLFKLWYEGISALRTLSIFLAGLEGSVVSLYSMLSYMFDNRT